MIILVLVFDKFFLIIFGILEMMFFVFLGSCIFLWCRFSFYCRFDGEVWGIFLMWVICNMDSFGCMVIFLGKIFCFCLERFGCFILFFILFIMIGNDDDEERCVVDGGKVVEKILVGNLLVIGIFVIVIIGILVGWCILGFVMI